ncbi:STAS domain-containing protein [Microbispora sp. GKU 823]|uniref:STAS domain-containing protein n=1 Tax=Microbispora sp. GKU 823 TaxID=1652100 RepID=UPI0009A39679|nr:STAS domain-containing protein [Microbispora sp. GKU 823]OPG02688.1 hypothetical protein B1L11_42020 [Microbispora sp. GKU 823]
MQRLTGVAVPRARRPAADLSEEVRSGGLSVLVFTWKGCQERGIRLVLTGIDPRVESALRITNLLPHFERSRSVGDALAADADGQPLEPA